MERLTAHYERREGVLWRAFVEEAPGVHAAGRSLSTTRDQLRAALIEHGHEHAEVLDKVKLPSKSREAVESAAAARQAAAASAEHSAEVTLMAARALVDDGLSMRDVATVLGLSHTRVQQLLREQRDDLNELAQ